MTIRERNAADLRRKWKQFLREQGKKYGPGGEAHNGKAKNG